MDEKWVDHWLAELAGQLGRINGTPWALFEPTADFYSWLESGDDGDLAAAEAALGRHLGLRLLPPVAYEWGLRMKPEVAGQIRAKGSSLSRIQIPLYYAGKPHALGGILAHELTHEYLARLNLPDGQQLADLEPQTDLASIALGLGKLVLNGTVTVMAAATGEVQTIGYLSPELKAYAYRQVNRQRAVADGVARACLTDGALRLLAGRP